MRSNLPVSAHEFAVPPGETLVSVTDLQGRITYCNPAFIHVSGFPREELLDQPHSLVRHPDMPAEAFRDMWATIRSGSSWTGLVKNRRKNGDFYWVRANAMPMLDAGRVTGFLSVRTAPSRLEVGAADALYRRMQQEAAAGLLRHGLRHGEVVRLDAVGRLVALLKPSTQSLLVTIQALATGATAAAAMLGSPWWLVTGVGVAACALASGVSHRITVAPLQALMADANALASGDLVHRIRTGSVGVVGKLQQALQQLSVNLRTVVQDVRHEVRSLEQAVQEIASGNQDLSARTESQASSLQQTAASMEQINGTAQQSAQSATRGSDLARQSSQITQRGNAAVQAVSATMGEIGKSSRKVRDIVSLIESIAFQTNILALNAAVEAARAGEQGRGFAVVAAEVRSLAQRAAHAARDVKGLVEESARHVHQGQDTTTEAQGRMDEALRFSQQVGTVLAEISLAASEQQAGIAQINQAVSQMDSITQQNAALVEQLAASAQAVTGQVRGVRDSMGMFRLAA